ncbi:potassium channel subfamily K member 13-like [Scleropages formosus]|uniref:Potassium channel subfamily K member 13-like n=1 Tax=Scleropages formosus TaxID=113540 RepID=A0A0N8K1F3_SCLFO|nr:potassium channel subfamily K member 13-like [Scleropages formosus]KPP74777.1 potassium channel subfamily K member 13-like [Scleropages formosus]
MARRRGAGGGDSSHCCSSLRLNEDNARFCLLAMLILLYLLCGAAIFSALEHPSELRARRHWDERLGNFTRQHGISLYALRTLLRQYEEANVAGIRVDALRPRWDFSGAFYFVGTVVSTIGFGMTTPATIGGKVFLIFYGLIGCAATILFFNLFLERIITMLAYIMRWFHERQLRRTGAGTEGEDARDEEDSLEGWKPSVYYVMLILGVAAMMIACSASALYSAMEDWDYFESLYFCFVAFSTIGFGDLVSSQREKYKSQEAYRVGNCLFILMGVCCIYSLFNVISIIIKQTLNWILSKLDCRHHCSCPPCCRCHWLGCCFPCFPGKRSRHLLHPARGHHRKHHRSHNAVHPVPQKDGLGQHRCADVSVETVCDSETDGTAGVDVGYRVGRRLSDEMISVKDFMASNKVSLAILQKQLSETAHGGIRQNHVRHNGFTDGVGAFAIMNNRLQETSVDR